MVKLIEEKSGYIYELNKEQILLGRPTQDSSIQIDIPIEDRNQRVSRRHAIIHHKGEVFEIENLSINRTLVNDAEINFCELKDGDRITIIDTSFVFQMEDYFPAEKKKQIQVIEGREESPVAGEGEERAADEQSVDTDREVRFAADDQKDLNRLEEVDSAELHPESKLFRDVLLKRGDSADIERIQSLFKITDELNATLEESELYKKAIDLLYVFLPMDRCAILIENKENGRLEPITTFRKDQVDDEGGLFVSKTVVNEVLKKRVAFLGSDASTHEQLRSNLSVVLKNIKSVMCAPLALEGEVIGVCYADSTSFETHFTQMDLLFLGIFCNLLTRAIINARTAKEAARQALITRNLERYFSPKLIEELDKGRVDLGGKEVEISVLFTDVRKFSDIARTKAPSELIEVLNEHFSLVADVILEFEGTIDKYIGDSVMAFWGAPVAVEYAPVRCVLAAIEIQRKMRKWQDERKIQGIEDPFTIGVGINTGVALAGNIGSPKRMDYTIVSDAVNIADRLCSLAEPNQVLISRDTYEKVQDLEDLTFNLYSPREVKGGVMLESFEILW